MRAAILLTMSATLALTGCRVLPEYEFTNAQVDQAIENFLGCDECADHQLYHVVLLGDKARRKLENFKDNPASGVPANYATLLSARWGALDTTYRGALRMSESAYVATHLWAYERRVQSRAAIALRAINRGWIPRAEIIDLVEIER